MIAATVIFGMFALLAAGMPVGFTLIATGALGIYWIGGAGALVGTLPSNATFTVSCMTKPCA